MPFTLLESVSLRRSACRRFRLEAAFLSDLLLRGGNISLDRISYMHVVIHVRVALASSSWNIAGVWVLTAAKGGHCSIESSSWQTRREWMPIADSADLNWWPHSSCCIFVQGSGLCHCWRVLSKLKQAQVCMLSNHERRLVLPLTDVPFVHQCCVSLNVFPDYRPLCCFFLSLSLLNYHHCSSSSWEHLELVFLSLLYILWRDFGERLCLCGTITAREAGTYRLTT